MDHGDIAIDDLLCGKVLRKQRKLVWTDVRSLGVLVVLPLGSVWYWVGADLLSRQAQAAEGGGARGVWFQQALAAIQTAGHTLRAPADAFLESARNFVLDPSMDWLATINRGSALIVFGILACTSLVCTAAYVVFRLKNQSFRYVLDRVGATRERPLGRCISEDITAKHESDGKRCNPGLSRTRRGHLQNTLAMLMGMVDSTGCKGTSELTALEDAKAHVQIAAMRASNRRDVIQWILGVSSIVVATMVYAGLAYISLLAVHVLAVNGSGTRAVLFACLATAAMLLTLTGTTLNVAVRRQTMATHKSIEGLLRIHRALGDCEHTGRRTIPTAQNRATIAKAMGKVSAGQSPAVYGKASPPLHSPRLLAAAVVLAAIAVAVALLSKTGVGRVATGLRMLHAKSMRDTLVRGGAPTSGNLALDTAESFVGEHVHAAHVVGWAAASIGLSATITGRSLIELGRATGRVQFEDDDAVTSTETRTRENHE